MAISLTSIASLARMGFDDIIDVRSPAEYAEDHLPGAISLPVLDNEERARVGTIYKQVSPFDARKIGAALVARNAAIHLQGVLADRKGGWRPLVYCWRGGQRSNSFASILCQVGWRAEVVEGGYKAWRGLVVKAVHETDFPAPVLVLDGNTGSAKTEILARLADLGVQVLDLEGLAGHRGSLFGALGAQPSQKEFESRLALAMARLDPGRPVVIEAESAKVGECRLPGPLWQAMGRAPRLVIEAPAAARAAYLTRAYGDLSADPARLSGVIERLRHAHSREVVDDWLAMVDRADFQPLALGLIGAHYDPRYKKHRERMPAPLAVLPSDRLDEPAITRLAEAVARQVSALGAAPRAAPGAADEGGPGSPGKPAIATAP